MERNSRDVQALQRASAVAPPYGSDRSPQSTFDANPKECGGQDANPAVSAGGEPTRLRRFRHTALAPGMTTQVVTGTFHASSPVDAPASTTPPCASRAATRLLEDQLDQDIAELNAIVIRACEQRRAAAARVVQDTIAMLIDSRTAAHVERIERARGLR